MKAITIHQPWASLLAHGIKTWETRTWPVPVNVLGKPVLIHASKTACRIDEVLVKKLDLHGKDGWRQQHLPRGAIVGGGTISRSLQIIRRVGYDGTKKKHLYMARTMYDLDGFFDEWADGIKLYISDNEKHVGDWSPGRWVWEFGDVSLAYNPIPCRGYQRFWTVPDDVVKLVHEQCRS